MAFLPGALFAATLLLSPAAPQTDTTQDRLDRLHQRVLTACRHENRHGAMAARGVRSCDCGVRPCDNGVRSWDLGRCYFLVIT